MGLNNYTQGINNSNEFQISGLPYVNTLTAPIYSNGATRVDFPNITKFIIITNLSSNTTILKIGFTENNVRTSYETNYTLKGGQTLKINAKISTLYFAGESSTVNFSIFSGLTDVSSINSQILDWWIFPAPINPIIYDFDFSSMNAGFNSSPSNCTYVCATSDRYVQIDENNVISGGGVDALPIGRLLNDMPLCLVLDGPITNYTPYPINSVQWYESIAGGELISKNTNGVNGFILNDLNNSDYYELSYTKNTSIINTIPISIGCMYASGVPNEFDDGKLFNAISIASYGSDYYNFFMPSTSVSSNYKMFFYNNLQFPLDDVISTFVASAFGYSDLDIWYPTGGLAQGLLRVYPSKIMSEYIGGTRLGAALSIPSNALDSGRLSIEIEWYPRGASSVYDTIYLWYRNSNNYVSYNGSTSTFEFKINGTSWNPVNTLTWDDSILGITDGGPLITDDVFVSPTTIRFRHLLTPKCIKFWIETGGGSLASKCIIKVDDLENQTIIGPIHDSISGTENISLCSNISNVTTGQMAGHIKLIRIYKAGYVPTWVQ